MSWLQRLHQRLHRRLPVDLRRRLADQDGLVAGGEVVVIGSLVFVVGILLVVNAWNVVDAHLAVDAVAQAATRAYVESDPGEAMGAAQSAADAAQTSLGRPGPADIEVEGQLVRCARVTVTAAITVHPVRLPFVGGFGTPIPVSASHTEIVDPFRSGLEGSADCNGL